MAETIWHNSSVLTPDHQLPLTVRIGGWEQCGPLHSYGPYIRNYHLTHYYVN